MDILKMRSMLSQGKSIYDLPLRVTYYARVSTELEQQLNSLDSQVMYYEKLIKSVLIGLLLMVMLMKEYLEHQLKKEMTF